MTSVGRLRRGDPTEFPFADSVRGQVADFVGGRASDFGSRGRAWQGSDFGGGVGAVQLGDGDWVGVVPGVSTTFAVGAGVRKGAGVLYWECAYVIVL